MRLLGGFLLISCVVMVNNQFRFWSMPVAPVSEDVACFQQGLLMGISVFLAFTVIRYRRALGDDLSIRKLYNEENDERKMLIRQKSGMPMLLIASLLLIVGGIIAGYFNMTIFYTLVAAGVVQMTLGAIVKTIYLKRF